jgi:hypothetical protein
MNPNVRLVEQTKIVSAFGPATPSAAAPRWVSLKNYERLTIVIQVLNGTTVTGTAVALSQATAVAGTGADTLPFTRVWRNIDTAANDTLTEVAVTSNTFTTDTTNSKPLLYVIEVMAEELSDGFDCVRVTLGNGANMSANVTYVLWPARYGKATPPSAVID